MLKLLKNPIIIFILFLLVGLGVYANSFGNQFFWDDDDLITNNVYIKDWRYLPNFFTENLIAGAGQITNYYRPVLLLSFSIDYRLWKMSPVGFHLTNLLIHVLAAWLIFILLSRIFERFKDKDAVASKYGAGLSFLVSLFFLIHPLQTEAVTYVSGRADPLSALFSLISIWFYLSFLGDNGKKWKSYVYCVLFFVLGILTKEQVILLPGLIVLIELVWFIPAFKKKELFGVLKRVWPLLLISIIYFFIHLTVLNFKGGADFILLEDAYDSSVSTRLFTFCFVMLSYFKLLFIPTGLHMAREISPVVSFFSWKVLSFLAVFGFLTFLSVKTWKKTRLVAFGFLWFFIILLPRTNILSINRPMYEHWLYLPMVGFWLAIFSLLFILKDRIKGEKAVKISNLFLMIFFSFLILIFSFLTILRNFVWRDPITFYENNLKYTPNSFIQRNNLGMAYSVAGRNNDAIREYRLAIEIKDVYPHCHHNLGNSLVEAGLLEEAALEYERAIEMSPEFLLPYKNLFAIYSANGEKDKAQEVYSRYQEIIKDIK